MKRGILINLFIVAFLLFLILLPLFIFAITEAIARSSNCEITNLGWGEGICKDMYTLAFLAGLFGSISSPIFILFLALYSLAVTVFFLVHLFRSKKARQPIPGFANGMFFSLASIVGIAGLASGIFLLFRWYQVSFISACRSLPADAPIEGIQNGQIAVGGKLPYPEGRPEQYIIEILSNEEDPGIILNELPSSKTPVWSPNGELVFSAQSKGSIQWGLYLADSEGQLKGLIIQNNLEMQYPDWAPDGQSIIFHRWVEDDPNPITEIFSVDINGGNLRQLTSGGKFNGNGRYSPDGKQIVYVSNQNGSGDIYLMDLDGANNRRLTYHPQDDIDPHWSPDGKYIVFASSRGSSAVRRNYNIFVMAADGTNQCQLTSDEGIEWRPVWSPAGDWIAYIAGLEDRIYMLHPDGSSKMTVLMPDDAAPLSLDWGRKP